MMFLLAFPIFAALVAVPVDGGLACCYPTKMEGARYYVKDKLTRYFVSDYERGYIFQTLKIGGPNFTIYDLYNEKTYFVNGDDCTEKPMLAPALFDPCLDEDDKVQGNALLGGNDRTIDVELYDYKVGRFSVFKVVRYSDEGCIPVVTQTQLGRLTLSTIYENVHTEISFPGIFDLLGKCNVEVRQGDEVEEDESDESNDSDS